MYVFDLVVFGRVWQFLLLLVVAKDDFFQFQFSELLNRLYVNISQPCPIRLRLEPFIPQGAFLRCHLRYQKSDYVSDPVTQCANHSYSETNLSLRGHVLRCKKVGVQYEKDTALGRYSLCLPLDRNEGT